jgi:hypothetical protein
MFDNIRKVICDGEKVKFEDLCTESRKDELVYPRQLIMYFARELKCGSHAKIAGHFGLDHCTSVHSCRTIENYYDTDKLKRSAIDEYRFKLTGIKKVVDTTETLKKEIEPIKNMVSELEQRLISINITIRSLESFIDDVLNPKTINNKPVKTELTLTT